MTDKKSRPTRKKKRVPKVKALKPDEYWKMRYLGQLIEVQGLKKLLAEKESAILTLRLALCSEKITEYGDNSVEAEKEYQDYRTELESKHKVNLKDVNIDSQNFTIHGG